MDRLARTREILARLVAFPTVTGSGTKALADYAAGLLEAEGATIRRTAAPDGERVNLFATFGPGGDGGLLLAGHADVVPVAGQPWTADPFTLTERNGRLYGRGTCDMKGFLACTLAMAPRLAEAARAARHPVHIAVTYDEEVGCFGAEALVRELRAAGGPVPARAIVGEPTRMRIIDAHKGCFEYRTRFAGLAGHGSEPEKGVSATEAAARFVARLADLKDILRAQAPPDSPFDPPWTTINVGRIMGGTARNVIAQEAIVDWEMRPVRPEDAEFVKAEAAAFAEALLAPLRAIDPSVSAETGTVAEVAGLTPAAANRARDLVAALTDAGPAGAVSFGTEAGLYQSLGTDTVVCGPGSIAQAHKADEFIEAGQLAACLALLDGIADKLPTLGATGR